VQSADKTNREAHAATIYWRILFEDFRRNNVDDIRNSSSSSKRLNKILLFLIESLQGLLIKIVCHDIIIFVALICFYAFA
jgi:hypothetical protein